MKNSENVATRMASAMISNSLTATCKDQSRAIALRCKKMTVVKKIQIRQYRKSHYPTPVTLRVSESAPKLS